MDKIYIRSKGTKKEDCFSSEVSSSDNVMKYVRNKVLEIKYSEPIDADESILNIPFTSLLLPLAWLTGSDIYVSSLDKTYLESMDQLRKSFMKMYPLISFKSNIHVEEVVNNKIFDNNIEKTGLFFSGGVDSIYSLIKNLSISPALIMVNGIEGKSYSDGYWKRAVSSYEDLIQKEELTLYNVSTNSLDIYDSRKIEHSFYRELSYGTFWARLLHSLCIIPLTAPLSIGRFNKILLSATHDTSISYKKHPWASQPNLDEKIKWANLSVNHYGYISRIEKINTVKGYLSETPIKLRVCSRVHLYKLSEEMNCSRCEKCFITILPMISEGLNPEKYGFKVNSKTFELIKKMVLDKKLDAETLEPFWLPFQKHIREIDIPDNMLSVFEGIEEFFTWFKIYALEESQSDVWFYRDLYYTTPFSISRFLDELYVHLGIRIHDHSPVKKRHAE